ncbi:MAG: hypothetical protein AAFO79_00530 [Pseudomonadota bacterium]
MATRDNNSSGKPGSQGNKPGAKPAAEKTPKATLDLKATEMPNKGESRPSAPAQTGAKDTGKPASTAATTAQTGAGKSGPDKGAPAAAKSDSTKTTGSTPAAASTSVPKVDPKSPSVSEAKPSKPTSQERPGARTGSGNEAGSAKASSSAKSADTGAANGKSAAGTTAPAPAPKRKGGGIGGFITHMAAGIIGAAAVVFGTQYVPADVLPEGLGIAASPTGQTNAAQLAELNAAVGALRADVSSVQQAQTNGAGAAGGPITLDNLPSDVRTQLGQVTNLQAQVESLVSQLATAQDERAALATKLTQAEAALQSSAQGEVPENVAGRLGQLEESFRALAAAGAAGEGGPVAQVAALTGRLNDFETELDTKLTGLRQSVQEDVAAASTATADRLKALSDQAGAQLEGIETVKAASRRIGEELEGVRARTDRATSGVGELREQAATFTNRFTQLTEQLDGVTTAVTKVREDISGQLANYARSEDVTSGLAGLEASMKAVADRIDGVASREATRAEGTRQIVLALELSELKRTISRGRNFSGELARVEQLAPGALDVAALQPFADKGVPTATTLNDTFAPAARRALDTELQEQNASWMDQLVSGAQSIVKVRRTGEIEGSGTEAVVARMEARLAEGDLIAAAKEAGTLGEPQRAALGDWLNRLEARVAVDRAIAVVEDQLKGSLAGASVSSAPDAALGAATTD